MIDPHDLVRDLFRALNRGDPDAVAAFYHSACLVEGTFGGSSNVCDGRDLVRLAWAAECALYRGAPSGPPRFDVRSIAGMQTGWGWVRADWRRAVQDPATGVERHEAGYSHFWIEDGLIRRQRNVIGPDATRQSAHPPGAAPISVTTRAHPIVGVGAVILMNDGCVVLVRRTHEPLAGQWSLPGGTLELGETLEAGTAREVLEETGLTVDVGPVVDVFDRILVDETEQVRYHFVLVDYLCRPRTHAAVAGSDVDALVLVDPSALGPYRLTEKAQTVIARALQMNA
jgi:8-oxo-dGTP diphosphatase